MARKCSHFMTGSIYLFCSMSAIAADIYVSEQTDGTLYFSTQRINAASTQFLQDKSSAAPSWSTPRIPSVLTELIARYANQHAVDVTLVNALIDVESHYQPTALSPKGAVGPMQLMPATARRYHVTDRADLAQNIDAGVHYLKDLLVLHKGNEALALASYNAGEGAVKRHGQRIPPYRETMLYVAAVLARAQTVRSTARNAVLPLSGDVHAAPF